MTAIRALGIIIHNFSNTSLNTLIILLNRHFWLQTKLEDNELDKPNHNNRFYKFKALKPIPTSETQTVVNNPEAYIARQGFNYDIDGLLFYHRETNYRGGSTPLVCWVPRDHVHNTLSST